MRRKSLIWILVVLLIPTMACGLLGGDDEGEESASSQVSLGTEQEAPATEAEESQITESAAEPEAQEEQTDTEADQPEAGGGEKTAFSGTSDLDQFSSYRVHFQMNFDGTSKGQPSQGVVEMVLESIKEPEATHLSMSMEGSTVEQLGGSNSFEFYDVGGTMYMYNDVQGGEWISMPSTDDSTFSEGFFAPDEDLELPDTALCDSSPEVINGISAVHCTFTEEDVQSEDATFESLIGSVWVAEDGDYIVKYQLDAEGFQSLNGAEGDFFDYGSVSFLYELLEVDTNFEITPPAEAMNAESLDFGNLGLSEDTGDMPVLDDAEELVSLGGIVTYYTNSDVAAVVDFYRQELPAMGYTEAEDTSFVDEQTALLSFENAEGKTVTLTIGADESGRTNVGIIPSE